MADYHHHHERKNDEPSDIPAAVKVEESASVEVGDRGLFHFLGKKKEEKQGEEEVIASDFEEKVQVWEEIKEEPKEEETKHAGLVLEKLHRSSSSSSSSSAEEEAVEGGEKKKKKKNKEKLSGENKAEGEAPANVPIEKYDDIPVSEPEQKKGFLDKIKEKLPGGKKTEEVAAAGGC